MDNFLKVYSLFVNHEDDEDFDKINVKTLVTTGQYDVGSTTEMTKNLSEVIKNSKYKIIKNGKHLCSIECSDDVNKEIRKFIDQKIMKLKKYQMFIDGEWVDSDSKKTFETLNPENNKPWAKVPEASAKDVDKAVKAAQKAFEGEWPKLFPRERAKF